MSATDRLGSEQAFHDRQALQRAAEFRYRADDLAFDDASYLDHESWIRPAFDRLGDVRRLRVLDLGCGHGMAAVVLARRGARVVALDLSSAYLGEARHRAAANGVSVEGVVADGARLPFADASFDRVWGNAILHHLDVPTAARELHRVLRPGGKVVLCEPWGGNPLLRWARRRLPYPGKGRTADEEPLRHYQVQELEQVFSRVEWQGHQLLSMAGRVLRAGSLPALVRFADAALLAGMPWLKHYCRYVVLTLCR